MTDRRHLTKAEFVEAPCLVEDVHERMILGALVTYPDETVAKLGADLDPTLFLSAPCKTMLLAAASLLQERLPLNVETLTRRLGDWGELANVGGAAAVTALATEFACIPLQAWTTVALLRDRAALRIGAQASEWLANATGNTLTEPAEIVAGLKAAVARIEEMQSGRRRGGLPEIEDLADLLGAEVPEPPEVVEGLLHQGAKMVLGGGSKSFKTWLLTDLALSVAAGRQWMGFACVRGDVLYINLEIQRPFFRKRTAAIEKEKGIVTRGGSFSVWNLRGHSTDLSVLLPQLLRGIGEKRYSLIVVDPIYKVSGGRDENAAGAMTTLLNELERLAVETGAAVVFGAHFSKGNQAAKESIDRIGGSGVYARDPDTILVLTKHEEDEAFTVDLTLRNHPPIPAFVVRWQFPLMQRDETLDPAKLKQPGGGAPKKFTEDDMLEILGKDELTMSEWQERAADPDNGKISSATFYRVARELKKARRIKPSRLDPKKWFRA